MGQSLSAVIGFLLVYVHKLQEKYKELFKKETAKDYYNNDILLKDDGHQASKVLFNF
jgi:hypothetical protein